MPPRDPAGAEATDLVTRPPHIPTEDLRRQVRTMAAAGLSAEDIGKVLLEPAATIKHCYSHELESGVLLATAEVGAAILQVARNPQHPQFAQCAFFWQRARAGWRDVRAVDKTGGDLPEDKKNKLISEILNRIAPAGVFTPDKEKAKK